MLHDVDAIGTFLRNLEGCYTRCVQYSYDSEWEVTIEYNHKGDSIKVERKADTISAAFRSAYDAFIRITDSGVSLPILAPPEQMRAEYTEFEELSDRPDKDALEFVLPNPERDF